MNPETRAALVALIENKIKSAGYPKVNAVDMRLTLETIIYSLVSLLDDKDVAGGYPSLNDDAKIDMDRLAFPASPSGLILFDNGHFEEKSKVVRTGSTITMDPSYSGFVYTAAGSAWTSPEVLGNKMYMIANRGSGSITLNYPGGANKMVDMAAGGAGLVNTVTIGAMRMASIVDDGVHLLIYTF